MRGPLVVTADLSTWYPLNLCGVAMTNTGALIGRKNAAAAGQVDPWNAPLLLPATADLASGLTTGLWVVGGSAATQTYANADQIPGPRWINYEGLLYGISYDSAGSAVSDASSNYFMKPLSLCTVAKSAPGGQPSKSPATYANNATTGTNAWTIGSPNNATSPLQSQTKSAGTSSGWNSGTTETGLVPPCNTPWLFMTNFGFSIPSNAVVVGVEAQFNRLYNDSGVGSTTANDADIVLVSGGGGFSSNLATGTSVPQGSFGLGSWGGSGNLWGVSSIAPSTVNGSTFGIAYIMNFPGSIEHATAQVNFSTISMTVYYYVPETTQYLEATNFGFALPSSAVVQGIAVTVTRDTNGGYNDNAVQLVKGGTIQSTNRSAGANVPGSMTAQTFGGSTDLWGTSWAYTDINASTFGAVYQAVGDATINVQSITIQVWYTATNPAPVITVLSNAPHGAFDLIGYQERVWLLGGIDTPGSLTVHEPTTLYFTNPGTAGIGTATNDWKDPVGLITNKIKMDGDSSDYGVGLAVVRNGMLIFRRASVWLLRGTTTANYALVPITRDLGCVDARSIIETAGGVYFISAEGLMLTNGSTVANVSGSIMHTLQTAIRAEQKAVIAGQGGYVTCGRSSHGQLIISVGIGSTATAGSIVPIFTAMYDPTAAKGGVWTRLTSGIWTNDGSQSSGNNYCGPIYDYKAPKRLLAIGDRYITAIEDQSVGQSMFNYNAGLYDQLPSGGSPYLAIPAAWGTTFPAITTSAYRRIAQGKRYYLDYNFGAQALVPSSGWTMQPFDGNHAALDTAQGVPLGAATTLTGFVSGVTPVPGSLILRFNRDWYAEIKNDVTFVITWSDIARAAQAGESVAEIYGMGVEIQRSREQRGAVS